MYPTLFELSLAGRSFAIDAHGLLLMLGAIAGLLLTLRLGGRTGLQKAPLRELALELMLVGAVGARMAFVASHASAYLAQCSGALGVVETVATCARPLWLWEQGFSSPGGLVAALLWLWLRVSRFDAASLPPTSLARTLVLADLFTPGLALAHVFGKLGCLLAGCCYGPPTSSVFGLRFPDESVAYQALLAAGRIPASADRTPPLHPVQLYEAVANLVLCVALTVGWRRWRLRPGVCIAIYLIAQVALRAWLSRGAAIAF